MNWQALVLAGTRPGGDAFAASHGVSHKALIEAGGTPMLLRVIAALREAGCDRIVVAADDPAVIDVAHAQGCGIVVPAAGPSASVLAGLDKLGSPLLVTTSDHALLTATMVGCLLQDTPRNADVSVMLAHRNRIETAVPGSRRTYLKFADGSWSGCNLFLLQTKRAHAAIAFWSRIEKDRKRPWRIAARLGPAFLAMILTRRLSASEAVARLGRKIGVTAALVPAQDGLAAVDVDKQEDLEAVRAILENGRFEE